MDVEIEDHEITGTADQQPPGRREAPRPTPPPRRQDDDELVDEASEESFPASDPPSYTPEKAG